MFNQVSETVSYIQNRVDRNPKIGIILGSGLGSFVDSMTECANIYYRDNPNFPESTVEGHEGRLVFGKINGVEVLAMQGRFHYYEGYTMKEVTYPVYVMQQLEIETMIVTNACGGINKGFKPGELMIISDFINLMGDNPLIGKNDNRFGPRFPVDKTLIEKAKIAAKALGTEYQEGVYAGFMGPYYETAAEIRAYGTMGADAIGMSTVPETIVANYLGLKVLGISCITNMATGIQTQKHSHANVVAVANEASEQLCDWVIKIVTDLET
jgi:purine-nucleoside phosphorylase